MIAVRLALVLIALLSLANLASADFVSDFCPLREGQAVSFNISVASGGALVQDVIYWREGNRTVRQLSRRTVNVPNPDETYLLSLIPNQLTDLPTFLPEYLGREGRSMRVDRDQLGLYNKDVVSIFWVQPPDSESLFEIRIYDPDEAPIENFEGYGWSTRLLLTKPGSPIPALSLDEREYEQYIVKGLVGGPISVMRKVAPLKDTTSPNGAAFTEETIFEKGVGPISLIQEVGNDASRGMDWHRIE